jgi:hypothetical protein
MNVKRFALACVAVYVVYQALSFIINMYVLGDTYQALSHVWRPEAEMMSKMWIMLVTNAIWSVMFCYIFVRGREGRGLFEGLRYGAMIGIFFSLTQSYELYVVLPIPYELALSWFLSGMAFSMGAGMIVAAIYKPAE